MQKPDGFRLWCRACDTVRNRVRSAERFAASKFAGVDWEDFKFKLTSEQRADIMSRYRAAQGVVTIQPKNVASFRRPSPPRRARQSFPTLLKTERRARRHLPIRKRAASGPGFVYIMYDSAIYAARCEMKIGLTDNLNRRLGQAHNLGDFKYLGYVAVSDMRAAEAWIHRVYSNECVENERFTLVNKNEARALLDLVAVNFPAPTALFVWPEDRQLETA